LTDPQRLDEAHAVPHQSFAALRHPGYRAYFLGSALAMMADSVEHVISYWIMFQKFHSPALGGFAMLSHWLPFLFFAVYSGALADRFDSRRLIQLGMLCFMGASLGWGILFLTDSLQMWHAMALLVLHGFAGVGLVGLVMAHVYFALRPDLFWITRGMIFGWITRRQYLEHHDRGRWNVKGEKTQPAGRT